MIAWLCDAFGFETRLGVEGDDASIVHSELSHGDGVVMVGQEAFGTGASTARAWSRWLAPTRRA